jgi:hypothetical protein
VWEGRARTAAAATTCHLLLGARLAESRPALTLSVAVSGEHGGHSSLIESSTTGGVGRQMRLPVSKVAAWA